jgi:hypothetical protein
MKKIRSIGELKTHVAALESKLGTKAPCCVWIVTNDDLMTEGETTALQKVSTTDAKMVLESINQEDHDYIVDTIAQVIENELSTRGL